MIRVDIKRSKIYNEIDDSKKVYYFDCKQKQYLHNIDTFYYSVYLKNDSNDLDYGSLFSNLKKLKDIAIVSNEIQEYKGLQVRKGSYAMVYNYRLSEPDYYDIFIADYLPNNSTPRIVVQLRSFALWQLGDRESIINSFDKVLEILNGIAEIDKVLENRIDYAYHTNSIQNPYKFFSDVNLDKYLKTTLEHYVKRGDITKSGFTLDYFGLGKLKSNNVFIRNYNKAKEVIELNYKQFFFDTWFQNGLISRYDKYCYEYAYVKKNYNAIDEARLLFYLEYGTDVIGIDDIKYILNDPTARHKDIKYLADCLTPAVTTIMNIEFMTKRKFYYYADAQINSFSAYSLFDNYNLLRLFKVIDNREVFIDYITSNTVSFQSSDGEYLDFWKRLRSLKIYTGHHKNNGKYKRIRNDNLDAKRKFNQTLNNIAVNSLYNNKVDTSLDEDLSFLLSEINDNDLELELVLYDKKTGELMDSKAKRDIEYKYDEYKKKKYKDIKNRIDKKNTPKGSNN